MQWSLGFIVFTSIVVTVLSASLDDVKEACRKEAGFDGDIEKLNFNDPAILKQAKCAIACSFEKLEVLKADGSIDKEKQKQVLKDTGKAEELKKKYLKATDECEVTVKGDKCEIAFEWAKCLDMKAGVI